MNVLVTGSSGLVGRALVRQLRDEGHAVTRLVRRPIDADDERFWNPATEAIDIDALAVDAVVHLAGESIAEGRWNEAKKRRIRDSRVDGTRLLSEAIARAPKPPRVLVSASAVGFYGDTGEAEADERSGTGTGFLPDVCRAWEGATASATAAGSRVVNLRIGVVLSPEGGALARMLTPFRLGLAGRIGSGRQWMSWISLDDVVGAVGHALSDESLRGPVNAVAPRPVTNAEFTRTLGRVLSRPTVMPMPAFAARLAFGQMADDLLLASLRVVPAVLAESGFRFRHPDLESALRELLDRPTVQAAPEGRPEHASL
jgi:uncharacterized protein (TIGR01777 family)